VERTTFGEYKCKSLTCTYKHKRSAMHRMQHAATDRQRQHAAATMQRPSRQQTSQHATIVHLKSGGL
jgi:hypothetical protein